MANGSGQFGNLRVLFGDDAAELVFDGLDLLGVLRLGTLLRVTHGNLLSTPIISLLEVGLMVDEVLEVALCGFQFVEKRVLVLTHHDAVCVFRRRHVGIDAVEHDFLAVPTHLHAHQLSRRHDTLRRDLYVHLRHGCRGLKHISLCDAQFLSVEYKHRCSCL